MYMYVVEDYQRWGKRGYHPPFQCPRHGENTILPGVSPEGLYIKCGLCLFKKIIGGAEYEELRKANALAEQTFQEE